MTVDHFDPSQPTGATPGSADSGTQVVPLSSAQRSIWFAQQMAPETPFSVAQYIDIQGELDTALLTEAGSQAVREFDTAMVRLQPADDPAAAPVQVLDHSLRDEIVHHDFRAFADPEAEAHAWMDAEFRRPLDMFADRLIESATLRISDTRYFWYTRIHHILLDGYGAVALSERIAQVYTARATGQSLPPSRAGSLDDLHLDDLHYRSSTRFERDRAHWRERMLDLPEPIRLADPVPGASANSRTSGRALDAELRSDIESFAAEHNLTVASVVSSAAALYVGRMSGRDDVVLSLPVSARTNALLRRSGGMVSNVVPIRSRITAETTVGELLSAVRSEMSGALRHQRYRFEDMVRDLPGSAQSGGVERGFFGPAINIQMFHSELDLGPCIGHTYILSTGPTDDLAFTVYSSTGGLRVDIEANAAAYPQDELDAHHHRFLLALAALVRSDPGDLVADLQLLSPDECARLVPARGKTAMPAVPMYELLAQTARTHPNEPALVDGEFELTYAQLWDRAHRLARILISRGVGPGVRVAVLFPRGRFSVTAVLAVTAAGGAFVPVDPALPDDRIRYLLDDSAVAVGITGPGGAHRVDDIGGDYRWLRLDDDETVAELAAAAPDPITDAERTHPLRAADSAYLIYTSGSTGRPKGVVVSHSGLTSFAHEMIHAYGLGPGARTSHFCSPSFDASVLDLLMGLASGSAMVIVPPGIYGGTELADTLRVQRVTHAFMTPAALASMSPAGLDDLHTAVLGGEAVAPDLVQRWATSLKLINAYGPTEATVMATETLPMTPGEPVTIGRPIVGTTTVVLDHRLRPVPVGAIGELYLGGAGVALAYHQRPSLTGIRFIADPFGPPGARIYRTGDLARWNRDGQLEYLGRVDRQVKIRGFRIELGEIDRAIGEVAGVEWAAAEPQTMAGGQRLLVGYFTGNADEDDIDRHVRAELPAHMIPGALVRLDAIPMTTNGKVDRNSLPIPQLQQTDYTEPQSDTELAVAQAFSAITGVERVGRADNFFTLGGNSLMATQLVATLAGRLEVDIPVRWVFEAPTVSALAARAAEASAHTAPELRRSTDDTPVPVSEQQLRMWTINQFDKSSAMFNIPLALRLRGRLDIAALESAVVDVVERHDTLRTIYPDGPDGPVQQVLSASAVDLRALRSPEDLDTSELMPRVIELAASGFDVATEIPLNVRLLRLADDHHVLVCVAHHIAADGSSTAPLARDLALAYHARSTATVPQWDPLPVRYGDYTRWHRDVMGTDADPSSRTSRQLSYWRRTLDGLPDLLPLPTDRPRPTQIHGRGGEVHSVIDAALADRIRSLAAATGTTPFMVAHSILAITLARLTGTEDIAVGTPVAGRSHRFLTDLVGMFVGTVVLRTPVRGDQPFTELLATVRDADLAAFEHSDIPFDRLVDMLKPRRSMSHHPIFQVGFSYQNMAAGSFRLDDLDVEILEPPLGVAKSDLHLTLVEEGGGAGAILVQWDYDLDLFEHDTIERWHAFFIDVLHAALADHSAPVGDLAAHRRGTSALVGRASGRAATTLTELLSAAFEANPEAAALGEDLLVDGKFTIADSTYGATSDRVNRLARSLIAAGVGPEVRVAVAIRRSRTMVDAVLAVLAAGGAYVPIDPDAPVDRNTLILGAADPAVIVVADDVPESLPTNAIPVISAAAIGDHDGGPISDAERTAPVLPGNTAYVIYTSGSTGTPKGVALPHAAIAAQLQWKSGEFPVAPGDTLVLKTPFTFDLSVWELFWPLVNGARLVIADADGHRDPRYIADLLDRSGAVAAHFVPSLLDAHLDAIEDTGGAPQPLPRVLCIGEALNPATAARAAEMLSANVFNLYGPTEAAVGITGYRWPGATATATVSIGAPVDDSAAVVLDSRLHETPLGVVGELYLRGVQLATAYDGRADLTAGRFIADPDGHGQRLYRTGDLARIHSDGQLEFLGRNDFQVKIRGLRIELGEIESALTRDPSVAAAVVVVQDEELAAYLVPAHSSDSAVGTTHFDADAVLDALRTQVPGYMVPSATMVLSELPHGVYGKVDRKALPPLPRSRRAHVAPQSATEHALVQLLEDLLPEGGSGPIGITDDFFELGGNSLLAARLSARIGDHLGVILPVRAFFDHPTVADLARRIDTSEDDDRPRLIAADRAAVLPLSRAQRRMWLLDQIDPGTGLYNLPLALRLQGRLDTDALDAAVRYVLSRNEVLRTTYPADAGIPRQQIHSLESALRTADLDIGPTEIAEEDIPSAIMSVAAEGFDLARQIPLRLRIFRTGHQSYVVVLVVHHIAADGWSTRLLLGDLLAGYTGTTQALSAEIQYADFAVWQSRLLGDAAEPRHHSINRQFDHWRNTLSELPGPLELPVDRPRPANPSRSGSTVEFSIDQALVSDADTFARAHRATFFHVVHAALAVVLSRLSGSDDIVIGTPVAGRGSGVLDSIVGMFAETVVLRTPIASDRTVAEFLENVRSTDLAAQANSEIPFDEIADAFEVARGAAHHPIFQVMLAFGDPAPNELVTDDFVATPVDIDIPLARFDLHLTLDVPPQLGSADSANEPVRGRWTYSDELFDASTIIEFAGMLQHVLRTLIDRPHELLQAVEVLPPNEIDTVVHEWGSATALPADPTARTLPDLLAGAAIGSTEHLAGTVRDATSVVSAARFRARVARTARALIEAGVGPETTVAVAVPRSIDMLVGIHAVVAAGGAYVPIDPALPAARIEAMLTVTDPVVVIADAARTAGFPETFADRYFHPSAEHLAFSDITITDADRRAPLLPEHPAYVLFTSGSTGVPKAVSVSHNAIVNRLRWMQHNYPIDLHDTVLQKTPITFDVSVWELFWPSAFGAHTVLAAPDAHRDPHAIADLIDRHSISVIHFVPTMLDAFLEADIADAQLHSLRLVFTSGEALGRRTATRLLARTTAQLHNLYGPTEAAVDVTAVQITADFNDAISIGRPTAGNQVYVLDHRLRPVPAGVTGELYLAGVQLARGYHGRADLSAGRFIASPWGGGERLYRTGDLVRWRRGGTQPVLDYQGRSDFQIKIRGQRVELGDIEAAILSHSAIAAAVVVLHDDQRTGPQLVAHVVVNGTAVAADLRTHMAARLPDHMVPAHVLITDALPVTPSGKVDRKALPAPEIAAVGSGREATTATEIVVLEIIRELLGERIGVDDDFFEVGGNSLIATRVIAAVGQRLGARLAVRTIFDGRTAAAIAAAADHAPKTSGSDASITERPSEIPLSPAQMQMWLHNRIEPASSAYVILAPVRIPQLLAHQALRAAVRDVVERHEILRTIYPESLAGPRQEIADLDDTRLDDVLRAASAPETGAVEQHLVGAALAEPFDLTTDLPLRVYASTAGQAQDETVIVLAIHHVAGDGWSLRVLAADLVRAYAARATGIAPDWSPLPLQYADHVVARAARLGDASDPASEFGELLDYWRAVLADIPPLSAPESDGAADDSAAAEHLLISPDDTATMRALADAQGSTLFGVLHSALAVTLSRSGVGDDVIIGTPVSGRLDADVADLVGMFVSMIPLRLTVDPFAPFRTVVAGSREVIVGALDHSDLDVEEIADHLGLSRSGSRHPLIQVTLTVDGGDHPAGGSDAAAVAGAAVRLDIPMARFDLEFTATVTPDGGLDIGLVHRPEIYRQATASALLARLGRFLESAVAQPDRPLRDIDSLTVAEHASLSRMAGPEAADPLLLDDLLNHRGHRIVEFDVTGRRHEFGSAAGDSATNRLARLLMARGAQPETTVALAMSRSAQSVVGMRAVAATGAAFVPVDPTYPADRIEFMLTDSACSIVVTTTADLARIPDGALGAADMVIVLDDPVIADELTTLPDSDIRDGELLAARHIDQLAYLIYTSGSTGRPKAVAVTHRGLSSFIAEQQRHGVDADSRVLHFASPSFDATILELVLATAPGATTVIAPTSIYGSGDLAALLRDEAVTHAFMTPGALDSITPAQADAPDPLPLLQTVVVGGDTCPPPTARRWISWGKAFFNAYGPTESTIMSTMSGPLGVSQTDPVSIGRAVTGSRISVLDKAAQDCAPGVAGELHVAGVGLARGYHGRAALTAVTFTADPDGPPGSRRYRTGDLVRSTVRSAESDISFTHLGRVDQQVKIRGHRIETGEIESVLHSFPGVNHALVIDRPGPDGISALVAYVLPSGDTIDSVAVAQHLRLLLPSYAVPAAIVVLAELPLTPTGKINRRALPEPRFDTAPYIAPSTPAELLVASVFGEILGRDRISMADNFFDAGGNSLSAARAVARLRTRSGRTISVPDLFEAPTAAELVVRLQNSAAHNGPRLGEIARPDRIPLSPAQRRMWFLNRFDATALTENIPVVLRLTGDLDVVAFDTALGTLIADHEVLRTYYPDSDSGPYQVAQDVSPESRTMPITAVRAADVAGAVREVTHTSFDVTTAPPVRAELFHVVDDSDSAASEYVFVLVLHHIAADGLSMLTLASDLAARYAATVDPDQDAPAAPELGYADFALWQQALLDDPEGPGAALLDDWRTRLQGAPPVTDLPLDRSRPVSPTLHGSRIEFAIGAETHSRMAQFAADHGASVYMVAHTALAVLLGRLGDNRDVVIGIPEAGRGEHQLERVVGMFVNTLAMRTTIDAADTGVEALATTREAALQSYSGAVVPFDRIVETLDLQRATTYHPVFQVAFSFQNLGPLSLTLPGVDVEIIDDDRHIAEFDLQLTLADSWSADPDGSSDGLSCQLVYATDLFDEGTAIEFTERYVRVLEGILAEPECAVGDLPLLDELESVAATATAPAPEALSTGLADEFFAQVRRTPDAEAVVTTDHVLTYRDFAHRVEQLGAILVDRRIGAEDLVVITAPRGLAQLTAMYATAAVGAAYVPVDLSAPERAALILKAADPRLVLGVGDGAAPTPGVDYLDLDTVDLDGACADVDEVHRRRGTGHPSNTAYVLFTSGSTGIPKGVSVSHGAIGEQMRWVQERCTLNTDDSVLVKTTAGFDASTWEYWWPLQTGARVVLAAVGAERDPAAILDTIERHDVSMMVAVPSALAMILETGTLPGSVRTIFCGGEEVSVELAQRVADTAPNAVLHHMYGPTEASVSATTHEFTGDEEARIPIGPAQPSVTVRVLSPRLQPVPPGVAGELYLGGVQLARGYHRDPARTAAAFVADPVNGSRMYRTGDLVRRDASGVFEYLGRTDHQLKVRGFRIEPGEIEAALHTCEGVLEAVVIGIAADPNSVVLDRLVGFVTGDNIDAAQTAVEIRRLLPAYLCPEIHVLESLPHNSNGKIDRSRLPRPQLAQREFVAPRTDLERQVCEIIAEVIGADQIGLTDDFFESGGNSLSAARAVARIRSQTGLDISVPDLFEAPTAAELVDRLRDSAAFNGPRLGQIARPPRIPLSPAQQRMWFLNRFDSTALTENIPVVLRLTGDLDVFAFESALGQLISDHDVLRTVYPDSDSGPYQVVVDGHGTRSLPVTAVRSDDLFETVSDVVRTRFDVTVAPPVRAELFQVINADGTDSGATEYVFALVLHHICADGTSMMTLGADLAAHYRARIDNSTSVASTPEISYADFALWQRTLLDDPAGPGAAQLESWRERLRGAPTVIDLPLDRPRPMTPSLHGSRIEFAIDDEMRSRMATFATRHHASVFMVAHTALAVLLGRIGDNADVVIGTPEAGRGEPALERVVGMFVNTLALRTTIDPAATGIEALTTARDAALHAYARSAIPFDRIVEGLDLPRSTAHHPVFQVAFSFQNLGRLSMSLPGIEIQVVDDDRHIAEFDLHFTLSDRWTADGEPDGLAGELVYATDLFDEATAAELARRYLVILDGLLATPDRPVGDLAILAPAETAAAAISAPAPAQLSACLGDGFLAQAQRTPDADAVVVGDRVLSYHAFADRVRRLATLVTAHGVRPEGRVAVTAPRGLAQLTAMYATAVVGAAYVPVDLSATDRARLILGAAAPQVIIGTGPLPEGFGQHDYINLDAIDLDDTSSIPASITPAPTSRPGNPAYVLFTSGSTGIPKGVSVSHGAVGEQLRWMQERYPLGSNDSVLIKTAAGFDLSVWEYWWPLQTGARIVLADTGIERDGTAVLTALERHRITVLPTVPSALGMALDAGTPPTSLRTILCIGEELPGDLVGRLTRDAPNAVLHNLYGPTEAAVSATGYQVTGTEPAEARHGRIPIGIAQPSVSIRVLDRRLQPVAPGVAGELYLGGVQLARGYHADPGRTAASFVADPVDGSRMYRTGDLVRRDRDGILEYLGRSDFQLKVRGFRIEPGEIEAVLRKCAGVADAVVTAVNSGGSDRADRLVGFVTGDGVDGTAVGRAIRQQLPPYLCPEVHVLESLPLNANGKVDRSRLPHPEAAAREYVAPRTDLERRVAEIIGEVTGAERVGATDNFFEIGGNSLSATRAAARLQAQLGRQVPVRLLFESSDVADVADRIDAADPVNSDGPQLVRIDDPDHQAPQTVPLAPAQRRIWEAVRTGSGRDWNVPLTLRLNGTLDMDTVELAMIDLIDRHEALRTRHVDNGDGPELVVLPADSVADAIRADLVPIDVDRDGLSAAMSEIAWADLDVEQSAPVRVRLLRVDTDSHVLMLVVHHLSADGQSVATLSRDMLAAFVARCVGHAPQLPEPAVRFRDYAQWRTASLGGSDDHRRQLSYWSELFEMHQPMVLKTDRPRPRVWDSRGAAIDFTIDPDLHAAIDRYAGSASVGVFAVLQAAFAVLLSDRAGRPDVSVATAYANRSHPDLDGVVGNFADDLPMRLRLHGTTGFDEVVGQVAEQLLSGLAHPDISGPELVSALGLPADHAGATGQPLFPATLILQESAVADATGAEELDLGPMIGRPMTIAREPMTDHVAKHELEFAMMELRDDARPAGIRGNLVYPQALFDAATAGEIVAGLLAVLRVVTTAEQADARSVDDLLELLP